MADFNRNPDNRGFAPNPPQWLREKMEKGDVVPFIGAGISMGAELPNGRQMPSYGNLLKSLLENMSEHIKPNDLETCNQLLAQGEFMQAADILEANLSTTQLYLGLRNLLNHLQPKPSLVHELLNLLNFEIIFTSNYDRLLETSLFPTPELVTYRDSTSLAILRQERKPFVFKIHGDLTRPETIVLGWKKYQELHGKSNGAHQKALKSFMQSLLQEKTFLFLGCSFSKSEYSSYFSNFAKIFKTPGRHCALVEKGSVPEDVKRKWRIDMGVEMLEFEPDEHYSQVWEFLASLKSRQKNPTPVPGSTFENFYLLDERSEYLEQQLAFEKQTDSCRFLTPGITNCLSNESYIKHVCANELERFRPYSFPQGFEAFKGETISSMLKRAKNIEAKLAQDPFEFRAVFFMSHVEEEMKQRNPLIRERYAHIFSLLDKYPGKLQLRMYRDNLDNKTFMKSSYALLFYDNHSSDIAYFYAPQANSNKFTAHMMQINTRSVTERVEHFERLWVKASSEKETIASLRESFNKYFNG